MSSYRKLCSCLIAARTVWWDMVRSCISLWPLDSWPCPVLVHDCTLITALFTVLLLTAASDSSSSISAINNNEMLTLLGLVGYADQLFALDSSCAHPRDTVKLNTCFAMVCVPATAGIFLWAAAIRAHRAVGWWRCPVSSRDSGGTVCRGRCHGSGTCACPRARPAHVHQPGYESLLTTLIFVIGLRKTKLTAGGLLVVF